METETTISETATSSEAVETPAASDTSTSQEASTDTSGEAPSAIAEASTPAYVPDYKLKVYDEEKELSDPFLKALIKDADSEKKVKEIAQKFLGFDTVKARHEKTRTEFQQYQEATQPVVQYYNQAANLLAKKDLEGFFDFLQVPTEEIFKYAVKKAEEAQLPESQRYQLEQQRQVQKDREILQSQNQTLQQQQQTQLSQFRAQELNWVMQRPDVTSAAQAFDSRNGEHAFRKAVVSQGLAHYAATGGDLSAEEATMAVMKMIGGFGTPTNLNGQPSAQQIPLIQQGEKPPIIPNITGRGASPVKKQVRSIEDLKKARDGMSR